MKMVGAKHPFLLLVGTTVVLNAIAWGIAWLFPRHESAAILHYTSRVGIDFVGEGRHIMVLPAVGLLIGALNTGAGRLIMNSDKQTAWILITAAPLVQLVLIIALVFLRFVNA